MNFVHARDHKLFPGVGNFSIFDLTFFPGGREFDSNFWENVKIPLYAPPPPPRRLDIDRCIRSTGEGEGGVMLCGEGWHDGLCFFLGGGTLT